MILQDIKNDPLVDEIETKDPLFAVETIAKVSDFVWNNRIFSSFLGKSFLFLFLCIVLKLIYVFTGCKNESMINEIETKDLLFPTKIVGKVNLIWKLGFETDRMVGPLSLI